MKLRLTSDGTPNGTRIYDEDTFADLSKHVRRVSFDHSAGGLPVIELELCLVEVSAYGGETRWELAGIGSVKAVTLESGEVIELDKLGLRDEVPAP